ncbi:unnamed protein product [Symbiodinium microadriaticum]|nr:unnamed protein product [Symbiodinium microadriaticum]CAE7950007.1 unnamed protein product [Symbiodinium sp. KB8]
MVPRILVKAGLAATRGVGFIQGKPASTAEALAVHLAKTSPTAGVLLADISMEACAMCTMKNQEQVHRQALLAYILRAFHLVQCPVLLLSGPAQVVADADKRLFEVALQLPSVWSGPPVPQAYVHQPFLLFGINGEGVLLHHACRVWQDQEVFLVAFGPQPDDATEGVPPYRFPGVNGVGYFVPVEDRILGLRWQAHVLASDQVAFALEAIAAESPKRVFVLEPLLLCQSLDTSEAGPLRAALPRIDEACWVISAIAAQGHWITLCWHVSFDRVVSWASLPMDIMVGPLSVAVAKANHMLAQVLRKSASSFRFSGGPSRSGPPGFCGHLALVDLASRLTESDTLPLEQAVRVSSKWTLAFLAELQRASSVPAPWYVAGVIPPLLEHGLPSVLKDKGVPAEVVTDRVKEAVQRVGRGPLQKALQASNQWRELKMVCSNAAPPFQLVLPSELKGLIDAKVAAGEEVAPRRKGKTKVAKGPAPLALQLPAPENIFVAKGAFEHDGAELPQLQLQDIGPQAREVVVVSAVSAGPYLRIDKPVSKQALGLLVLGPLDLAATTLKYEAVRFQATCNQAKDPLLLSATLLQIGDRFVAKKAPGQCMTLDLVPSVIVSDAGVYFEPRGVEPRDASIDFSVFWLPKEKTEALHGLLRPATPFMNKEGLWWAIQAVKEPPQTVLHIQQGEVLISEVQTKVESKPSQPPVVAARATLKAITSQVAADPDPLQTSDPWAAALAGRVGKPSSSSSAPPVDFQAVVKQVESNLRTKIAEQVEAANQTLVGRVATLESTVGEVVTKVQDQETRLRDAFQELFDQQTQRIEALLAPKRQRQE